MRLTPKNELEYRYRKLQQLMGPAGIDAVIVVQNADLFYFTGTVQSGALYVPASGDPLYLVQRDFLRARMESALKEVAPCLSPEEIPKLVAGYGLPEPKRIGLELDVLPVTRFEKIRALYPGALFADASQLIRRVRMVKTHYEIHILQDAAAQAEKIHRLAAGTVRAGMMEIEVSAELERLARVEGHQGGVRLRAFNGEIAFGRVLSGTDAATPSSGETTLGGMGLTPAFGQGSSYRRIERGEPVVVEFACCFDGYCVAQSRVYSIGEPSAEMRRGHEDMLAVQGAMMEKADKGASWGEIFRSGVGDAARLGHRESFLGPVGASSSRVGRGIGIEIDELPIFAEGFETEHVEPGMVFTLEAKLVVPGEGAVGVENTFYLSEEGLKRLTFSDEEMLIL